MKVLIIEDEREISDFVRKGLEAESFVVDVAFDGKVGLEYALHNDYDLVLLDINLPKVNGLTIALEIRQSKKSIRVIVLTIELDVETKVQMLALCDDYVTKPFSIEELIARARAVLRRGVTIQGDILELGNLRMDIAKYKVTIKGREVILRNKEFALLEYFMRNPGVVLSRSKILENVWDVSTDPFTNTVDVHIRYLRKKIDCRIKNKLIHTISGRGYKLEI